jgi:hypothetical protein
MLKEVVQFHQQRHRDQGRNEPERQRRKRDQTWRRRHDERRRWPGDDPTASTPAEGQSKRHGGVKLNDNRRKRPKPSHVLREGPKVVSEQPVMRPFSVVISLCEMNFRSRLRP